MKPQRRTQKHKSFDRSPKRPMREQSFEQKLRQFKKKVEKTGIIQECRKREYYEKPAQKRQRKKAEAIRRQRRRNLDNELLPRSRWH